MRILYICPLCNSRAIGKVGNNQFYCWDCFIEFSVNNAEITIYEVEDDGSLTPYMYTEQVSTGTK